MARKKAAADLVAVGVDGVIVAAVLPTQRPFPHPQCHVPMTVVGMTPRSAVVTYQQRTAGPEPLYATAARVAA